jgi:hypothetical protein
MLSDNIVVRNIHKATKQVAIPAFILYDIVEVDAQVTVSNPGKLPGLRRYL